MKNLLDKHLEGAVKDFLESTKKQFPETTDLEQLTVLRNYFSDAQLKDLGIADAYFPDYYRQRKERQDALVKAAVLKVLDNKYNFCKQTDGTYRYTMDASWDDILLPETIQKLCEEENPELALLDKLTGDYYIAEMWRTEDELISDIRKELGEEDFDESVLEAQISAELQDVFFCDPPMQHFLNQKVCVDILMDTGDGNYDFVLNRILDNGKIDEKAAALWLARQQGYTKEQLEEALVSDAYTGDSRFLKSMRQEFDNTPCSMTTLTFLVKMTVRQLFDLTMAIRLQDRDGVHYDATQNPDCGTITIGKETEAGLYNPWDGGGSVLEIELEKDVQIPIQFIWKACVDGHLCNRKQSYGYSVADVYGACDNLWKPTLKSFDPIDLG